MRQPTYGSGEKKQSVVDRKVKQPGRCQCSNGKYCSACKPRYK